MSTITGIRKTLYLSKSRDKDILDYISPLLSNYDFSFVIRGLIRDGILYRNIQNLDNTQEQIYQPIQNNVNVIQSNNSSLSSSLQKVVLEKKQVSDEDIEYRLDNF